MLANISPFLHPQRRNYFPSTNVPSIHKYPKDAQILRYDILLQNPLDRDARLWNEGPRGGLAELVDEERAQHQPAGAHDDDQDRYRLDLDVDGCLLGRSLRGVEPAWFHYDAHLALTLGMLSSCLLMRWGLVRLPAANRETDDGAKQMRLPSEGEAKLGIDGKSDFTMLERSAVQSVWYRRMAPTMGQ